MTDSDSRCDRIIVDIGLVTDCEQGRREAGRPVRGCCHTPGEKMASHVTVAAVEVGRRGQILDLFS